MNPIASILLLFLLSLGFTSSALAAKKHFQLEFSDRVDPSAPGEQIVFEATIRVSGDPAPDVRLSVFLPPDTTFVEARQQPDFSLVPATLEPGVAHLDFAELAPCGKKKLAACTELWLTIAVDPAATPDVVAETVAELSSSDAEMFPTTTQTVYTSIGSLAIRQAKASLGAERTRVQFDADVGRSGWGNLLAPPPPNIDLEAGVHISIGEPGQTPVFEADLGPDDLRCSGTSRIRCRPEDKRFWKGEGLSKLSITLQHEFFPRNNARVGVKTTFGPVPADFGPLIEVSVEAGGITYTDTALLEAKNPTVLRYKHGREDP